MPTPLQSQIIDEARKWLGTPYHHAADVRGVGVDCGMLIVRVFVDAGIVPAFDPRPYPRDWMLHRSAERYLGWVEKFADRVDGPEPGDIALFKVGRCLSHGGIVESEGYMIHAWNRAGAVVRREIASFERPLAGFWRVKGV